MEKVKDIRCLGGVCEEAERDECKDNRRRKGYTSAEVKRARLRRGERGYRRREGLRLREICASRGR